jgi:hypothetical protein
MNIFYCNSEGRADVPECSPAEASLDATLAAFRALDPRSGFLGVVLDHRFVLHLSERRQGRVQIELADDRLLLATVTFSSLRRGS